MTRHRRNSPNTGAHATAQTGLGFLLRQVRKDHGESLKTVAPKLGVTYTHLSKVESGVAQPSDELLSRLASQYALSTDEVFLAANRLPPDVKAVVLDRPGEIAALVRMHFNPRSGNG